MPRITRVYTRTGDGGDTGLATGERVAKDSLRVHAYGAVDELSSHIGLALSLGTHATLARALSGVQNELFHLGAELSTPTPVDQERTGPCIEDRHVEALEQLMDELMEELPPLENFVLPGGDLAAAQLQVARTVCRRAERDLIALSRAEPVAPTAIRYLNRLSDALFVGARYQNLQAGADDTLWDSRA